MNEVRQSFLFCFPVPTNCDLWEMYNSDMIVYGELLFIENMVIGGVLLYLTGDICGWKQPRSVTGILKFTTGSIMCGAFSFVIFLGVKGAGLMLIEVVFAACVCTVVFGRWRQAIVFILVTYFMGGIVMAVLLMTQQQGIYTAAGIYTANMKAAMLAVFICLGYLTVKQIVKTVRNKKIAMEHSYEAEIVIDEHIFKVRAFLDTGNRLKAPITGRPVAVASDELWQELIPGGESSLSCPSFECGTRFAMIPYESVGAKGMLQALRTDHINMGDKRIKGCLIAKGGTAFKFENTRTCELLISTEMVEVEWDQMP